jgi:hypothetical protein
MEKLKKINWVNWMLYFTMFWIGFSTAGFIFINSNKKQNEQLQILAKEQHEQDVELLNLYHNYSEASAELVSDFIKSNEHLECSEDIWGNYYTSFKSLYEYLNGEEL